MLALSLAPAAAGCRAENGDGIATVGGRPTATALPADVPGGVDAAMRRYAQCMRDHGVAMPDPDPDATARPSAPDIDPRRMEEATAACRSLLPAGELRQESPEEFEVRRQVARCIRENGYPAWPDPVPNSNTQRLPRDIDPYSAQVRAVQETCAKRFPAPAVSSAG
ncbi:hypothetical protein [Micromonospora purpureochromogenes]|uniref:hypothetical protein n=1 Tax=Micromonospora purpureochromogenes TaxID=47872 RepID=UPI000B5B0CF5|nr:hypothetical protein [Micromonospora purpureochromogenes]